jgi:hypothetical protein
VAAVTAGTSHAPTTSVGCHGRLDVAAPEIVQRAEGAGVDEGVVADAEDQVVAAVLAFHAELMGDPPHRGVIEQQGLGDRLQQVHKIVVSPHVAELVSDDRRELGGREAGEGHRGNEDDGTQPSDDGGGGGDRALQEHDGAPDAELLGETGRGTSPRTRRS